MFSKIVYFAMAVMITSFLLSSCSWHKIRTAEKFSPHEITEDVDYSKRKSFEAGAGKMYFKIESSYIPPNTNDSKSITLEQACDNNSILVRGEETIIVYAEYYDNNQNEKKRLPIFIHSFVAGEKDECLKRTQPVPLSLWTLYNAGDTKSLTIYAVTTSKRKIDLAPITDAVDFAISVANSTKYGTSLEEFGIFSFLNAEIFDKSEKAINNILREKTSDKDIPITIAEYSQNSIQNHKHTLQLYYEKENEEKLPIGAISIDVQAKISLLCDTPFNEPEQCSGLKSSGDLNNLAIEIVNSEGEKHSLARIVNDWAESDTIKKAKTIAEGQDIREEFLQEIITLSRYDKAICLFLISQRCDKDDPKIGLLENHYEYLEEIGIEHGMPSASESNIQHTIESFLKLVESKSDLKNSLFENFSLKSLPYKNIDPRDLEAGNKIQALSNIPLCRHGCYISATTKIGGQPLNRILNLPSKDNFISLIYTKDSDILFLMHGIIMKDKDKDKSKILQLNFSVASPKQIQTLTSAFDKDTKCAKLKDEMDENGGLPKGCTPKK